jgi:hypothetical protein
LEEVGYWGHAFEGYILFSDLFYSCSFYPLATMRWASPAEDSLPRKFMSAAPGLAPGFYGTLRIHSETVVKKSGASGLGL